MAEWALHGPEAKEVLEQFVGVPTQTAVVMGFGGAGGWIAAGKIDGMPAIFGIFFGMVAALFLAGSFVQPT